MLFTSADWSLKVGDQYVCEISYIKFRQLTKIYIYILAISFNLRISTFTFPKRATPTQDVVYCACLRVPFVA